MSAAGGALRWIGAVGMMAVIVLRLCVFFAPQVVFDVDPLFDPSPLAGLGPAGSLALDAVLLACAAAAMLGEVLAGRGVSGPLLLLALLPAPAVLAHAASGAEDLRLGSSWQAATLAAVALAHLARDPRVRAVLASVLLAATLPLLARGAANVTYEHDETIVAFEAGRADYLAQRGWAPGSAQAQIYERRLRQRRPAAWFVSTNIFGTVMAFGAVAWLGAALACARAGRPSGWWGAAGLIALAAAIGVWTTGSKGAGGALAVGVAVLVAVRAVPAVRRAAPWIALGLAAAALGAVVVRGALLPEGFLGDRSLLFRWHYALGSTRIIADDPWLGTGPGGFQAAYMVHRPPRSPEEVASAHAATWDWLATLGVLGAAWVVLVAALLWRAGAAARAPDGPEDRRDVQPAAPFARPAIGVALAVVLFGLVPAVLIEARALGALDVAVRMLGIIGFIAAAAVAARAPAGALMRAGLCAAATVVLVHGQIEMTFHQPGSAPWAWAVLGLAAGAATEQGSRRAGVIGACLAAAGALWVTATGVLPAARQQRLMLEAAARLQPLAEARARGEGPTGDSIIAAREAAAEILLEAGDAWPIADAPLLAAADQLERAERLAEDDHRRELILGRAAFALRRADERGAPAASARLVVIEDRLGDVAADEQTRRRARDRALARAKALTAADPCGIGSWRRLGDLAWKYGLRAEARQAYERALEADRQFELDELKRLSEAERTLIEARVREEDS